MKKIFIIICVIIVVLVGAVLAIPLFFKNNLLEVAQNTLNNQLNAEVVLTDLKLSLFKEFPQVSVEFQDVRIIGKDEFKNDTLLDVALVRAKMDLSSLFRKSEMSIEEIVLNKAHIHLKVAESGKANWDVAPNQTTTTPSVNKTSSEENEFQLQLNNIEIRDASFIYDDKQSKTKIQLLDIDFDISGNMYGNSTQLKTAGTVADFTLEQSGVNYVSKTLLDIRTLLDVNFDQMKFTIAENELLVNRLPLELSGSIEIPSDTTFVNLQLKTKESDFENFLALVPPVYESFLKAIETKGAATIAGEFKGFYLGENYPSFNLNINIADGNFHYADMPEEIKQIKADVRIEKPQGELDLMEICVKEAHAEIKNNPVDLTLLVKNSVSDPYFDGAFIGKINLNHLKDALPLDSVNMSGVIDANLFVKGNYSDVEAEAYDKIKSDGVVLLSNFIYESAELTQPIIVPQGKLDFSPKSIHLQKFNMRVGQSDFRLAGKVSNYLNYFLKDGVLQGNLQLNSQMINLNELLRLQVKTQEEVLVAQQNTSVTTTDNQTKEVLAFDVPEKIDISFNSNIENAIFDRLPITGITGSIRAVNEKVVLKNLSMHMLDGDLKMNGSYKNTVQNQPLFDFAFDISTFDIPLMYKTLSGVRSIMPVAGNSTGTLSSTMGMSGRLSSQLKLIASSANGKGLLSTQNLELKDSPLFNQLSGILKKEKLKNVTIDDFKASFTVEDGNLILRPFTTKIIGQETRIAGSLNSQSFLDMRLDFKVERELFGSDIEKFLKIIPGNEKIKMLPAGVNINGPVDGAKVNLDLSDTQKAVTDATKDDLKKSLDQLGKGLKKLFR